MVYLPHDSMKWESQAKWMLQCYQVWLYFKNLSTRCYELLMEYHWKWVGFPVRLMHLFLTFTYSYQAWLQNKRQACLRISACSHQESTQIEKTFLYESPLLGIAKQNYKTQDSVKLSITAYDNKPSLGLSEYLPESKNISVLITIKFHSSMF